MWLSVMVGSHTSYPHTLDTWLLRVLNIPGEINADCVNIGLGGTSLMNANVFLRADEDTMAMKTWPRELRQRGALDKCKFPLQTSVGSGFEQG